MLDSYDRFFLFALAAMIFVSFLEKNNLADEVLDIIMIGSPMLIVVLIIYGLIFLKDENK